MSITKDIVESFKKDDQDPESELSSDGNLFSLEWTFDNGKRLFIDIDAESGTIQVVWKTGSEFHQYVIDTKEDE